MNLLCNDIDAVVHLAAVVGDPACAKDPETAKSINWKASKKLFDICCENKNIKRFIFASTCSNYGKMEGNNYLNEESPLNPVSLYAKLKVKFEKYLLEQKTRNDFIPTSLRFATAYGFSLRPRFDLTVNEFVQQLTFEKELIIFGEQFWRPYCHVEDIARACIAVLESPSEKVKNQVFGVGNTKENYQKKMLVNILCEVIPYAEKLIKYVHKDEDPRDYRVDFSKINNVLNFRTERTIPDSIIKMHKLLKAGILYNPFSGQYKNI